jgi:hypothetical protein
MPNSGFLLNFKKTIKKQRLNFTKNRVLLFFVILILYFVNLTGAPVEAFEKMTNFSEQGA